VFWRFVGNWEVRTNDELVANIEFRNSLVTPPLLSRTAAAQWRIDVTKRLRGYGVRRR
jgi:hypothetical protein